MLSRIKRWIKEFKDLRYYAYHDELTGLYNRHYINNLDVSKFRYVYFIDINNLKEYNKQGHTAGDKHLVHCVHYVRTNYVNSTDVFIRYAGDEFILLSEHRKKIISNTLYSVGESLILGELKDSIEMADKQMIINKNKLKR